MEFPVIGLLKDIFGGSDDSVPRLPRIDQPPPGAVFNKVRSRGGERVRAQLATEDGVISGPDGDLSYRAGEHYIVQYANGDEAPVRREVFEHTYKRRFDGRYEKRKDVIQRYFTLPYTAIIATPEGDRRADPGDWIMQLTNGDLYPVPVEVAEEKYQRA